MKIAILGGSFNPLHIGHLVLADSVCTELGYDKVLFVPVFRPPHKEMAEAAPAEDRLAMIKKAVAGDKRFEAEPCEIDRAGVSYTYDTVLYLAKKYEKKLTAKIGVILGSDLFADYNKWNHASELADMADLILARRPQQMRDASFVDCSDSDCSEKIHNHPTGVYDHPQQIINVADFHYHFLSLKNPELAVSSTDIRERIADGRPWRYLVPDAVFRYIVSRRLYGYRTF